MEPNGRLKQRAIRSGFWMFGLRFADQALAVIRLVILARLLSPNDFGLMGIALVTMGTIDILSQTGFETALIQRKSVTDAHLDSAWTVGIVRGAALFALLYVTAPSIAGFFESPQAVTLMRAIGLTLLLRAFANIGVVYFQKELRFSRQFAYVFSGRVADFAVAIPVAYLMRNAWALLIAFLTGNLIKLVVSYLLHSYRPRLRLDAVRTRELFGFGKWILGYGMLFFFLTQGDKAFVGKVAGATMLGFYNIAYRISFVPASEIAHVIAGVTVPAYSKLQDSIAKIREGYLRVLQATGFAAVPLGGLLFILAPDIVRIFLGQKWMPAAPAMQALAIWGATRALTVTNDAVLIAVGRPRRLTKYLLFQLCVLAALIYPLTSRWGILGTSVAVALAGMTSSVLFFNGVKGIAGVRSTELARFIGIPLGAAVAASVATSLLRPALPAADMAIPRFIGSVVMYAFIYLALTVLLGRRLSYDVRPLLREIRSGLRSSHMDTPQREPG